jgi:K+ transporter
MTENTTMQTPKEDWHADDHIKHTHFELIQLLTKEIDNEKISITKFFKISKELTVEYELMENIDDKHKVIKEYIIRKLYKYYVPQSLTITDCVIEQISTELDNLLFVTYTISEEEYIRNLKTILDQYISN